MKLAHVLALALAPALGCYNGTPCTSPLQTCSDACVDLRSDPGHCGTCANACSAGLSCVDGRCIQGSGDAACQARTGGAFVTLGVCGSTVKLWTNADPFVTRAEALVVNPSSAGPTVPRFDLRAGSDCDAQWSWHTDVATATFVASPDTTCDACPDDVQSAVSYWLVDVGTWCPTTAKVLAVERR